MSAAVVPLTWPAAVVLVTAMLCATFIVVALAVLTTQREPKR